MKKKTGPFCKASTYICIILIIIVIAAGVRFFPEVVKYVRGEMM